MEREFIGVAQAFGSTGCEFGSRLAITVASNSTVYIRAGAWIAETDAHTTVQFTYDAGTNWITWVAASEVEAIASDGFLVVFVGDGTGGTGHLSQLLAWQ